jgi:hypothetical protein
VRIGRVRIVVAPLLFRLPWLRRFDGYAAWNLILLREPPAVTADDLLTHELCHVWQMQHRPLAMPLSYLRHGYRRNPYELEAAEAVRRTAVAERCSYRVGADRPLRGRGRTQLGPDADDAGDA